MRYVVNDREYVKIPAHSARLQLSGTSLETTKESDKLYNYQTLDASRYDMVSRGLDAEGFFVFELIPRDSPIPPAEADYTVLATELSEKERIVAFDPTRKRLHGNVQIPDDFVLYHEEETQKGSKYTIFVNSKNHFLLKIETPDGARMHNFGILGDPKGYLTRFHDVLIRHREWLSRAQIKNILHDERMYDGQKLTMGLIILEKQGLVKSKDGVYASTSLEIEIETGVHKRHANRREQEEREEIVDSLEAEVET